MKRLMILMVSAILLGSCTRTEDFSYESDSATYNVRFIISSEESIDVITRAIDEDAIEDFHLFLFGRDNPQKYHFDGYTPVIEAKIILGEYDVYAMANYPGITADYTLEQLEGLLFDFDTTDDPQVLPMSYRASLIVSGQGSTNTNIRLIRSVAKLSLNIKLQGYDYELLSAKICDIPRKGNLFMRGVTTLADEYYSDWDCMESLSYFDSGDYNYGNYSLVFYMPENLRATVPSITHQYSKNKDNAPKNATYLHLRMRWNVSTNVQVHDYYVYLGENNTDNFNIRRNSRVTYDISLGYNAQNVDTRVQHYIVSRGWYSSYGTAYGNDLTWQHAAEHRLGLESPQDFHRVNIRYEFDTQVLDYLRVDDQPLISNILERTFAPGEHISFTMHYRPPYYHDGNKYVRYTITCTDNKGYSFTDYIENRYFNSVDINIPYKEESNGSATKSGTIIPSNYEHSFGRDNIGLPRGYLWNLLYGDDGVMLKAVPEPGFQFVGWYKNTNYQDLLSTDVEYLYNPLQSYTTIWAMFEPI